MSDVRWQSSLAAPHGETDHAVLSGGEGGDGKRRMAMARREHRIDTG